MKFVYPAIFRKTKDNLYEGYFPDLTDCRAVGETLDEAVENAHEAALDWIAVELEEEQAQLPPVSDIDDLEVAEDETVRCISLTVRLYDGWDE